MRAHVGRVPQSPYPGSREEAAAALNNLADREPHSLCWVPAGFPRAIAAYVKAQRHRLIAYPCVYLIHEVCGVDRHDAEVAQFTRTLAAPHTPKGSASQSYHRKPSGRMIEVGRLGPDRLAGMHIVSLFTEATRAQRLRKLRARFSSGHEPSASPGITTPAERRTRGRQRSPPHREDSLGSLNPLKRSHSKIPWDI